LHVRRQWLRTGSYGPPKTKAGVRVIHLPDDLKEELRGLRVLTDFPSDASPIFASSNGTPLCHRNVTRRGWEPARELAARTIPALASVSFHDLRHAAASYLIAFGLDENAVATQMGHKDATTTRKLYAHLFDGPTKVQAIRDAFATGAF
jgi:integrase